MEKMNNGCIASPKTLKSRIQNGEVLYGVSLLSFSPTVAEILGYVGYDFVLIDMEHGPGGISDALPCIHALAATQTAAIFRVPENSPVWVRKAIDLGAQGIIFPMIEDPESATKAVLYCRYPPAGVRAVAGPIVRASKYGLDPDYPDRTSKELLIVCQIESEAGVKNVKEIASVDGVDMIMVGPLDLSASIGCLTNPKNEKVKMMIDEVEKTVLELERKDGGGPYLGRFGTASDGPQQYQNGGYRLIRVNVDVILFKNACLEDIKRFKSAK
ncbi:uncharacterized protein LOC129311445 [Prosopis cineraria]|uniref:uncharacterized protein LOC129311445 n=1 Tax=Prosopis cineraria TaxID=364024 RepID=UPI002410235C|nr:uncharacterized protein LOC129311445 [Prosopis cineraria]